MHCQCLQSVTVGHMGGLEEACWFLCICECICKGTHFSPKICPQLSATTANKLSSKHQRGHVLLFQNMTKKVIKDHWRSES